MTTTLRPLLLRLVPLLLAATSCMTAGCKESTSSQSQGKAKLLIASYEPTVELYKDLNAAFAKHWKEANGQDVEAETFHGPSGTQAKKIIEGNEVDIAALSVDFDVQKIAEAGLIDKEWRKEYPNGSVPYTSSVIFLVRKGNPKGVRDWEDLARDDVVGLAPDPLQGGGARWIYLSAWAHALRKGDDEAGAREFTRKVYDKAVLHPAMRQSTTHFLQTGQGDVLFGWENEILQIVNDPKVKDQYERVVPSDSIVIEVPVAIVDKVVDKRGTRKLAEGYLNFLYSPAGQEVIAKRYNRPFATDVAARHAEQFPPLKLFRFSEHFTSWPDVMKKHFDPNTGELVKMTKKG